MISSIFAHTGMNKLYLTQEEYYLNDTEKIFMTALMCHRISPIVSNRYSSPEIGIRKKANNKSVSRSAVSDRSLHVILRHLLFI